MMGRATGSEMFTQIRMPRAPHLAAMPLPGPMATYVQALGSRRGGPSGGGADFGVTADGPPRAHIIDRSGGGGNEQQDGSCANYRRRSHRYYAVHAASGEQRNEQASCIQRVHEGKSQ